MRIHATRSALALAAGSAAVFVVLLSGAQAEAGPAAVHPSVDVASAKVSGGVLHFAVDVTLPPPGQSRPSSACKGKVKLTEVLKGRRKAPHWTGQLGPDDGLCAARVKGSLPAGLLDRNVSFTITFGGNGEVAPFSHSSKLKLSPPAGKGGGNGGGGGSPSPGGNVPGPTAVAFTAADHLEIPGHRRRALHPLYGQRRVHPKTLQLVRELAAVDLRHGRRLSESPLRLPPRPRLRPTGRPRSPAGTSPTTTSERSNRNIRIHAQIHRPAGCPRHPPGPPPAK